MATSSLTIRKGTLAPINFSFISERTEEFFNCTKRNECLSGGFGCGKTYVACMKIFWLITHFRFYRAAICRQEYKTLLSTTYKTFMKICPAEFIKSFDQQKGFMKFHNGSEILWMHLDDVDEQTLKGLEINSCFIDQPEEVSEMVYTLMDSRIGRWDMAIPDEELTAGIKFEHNEFNRYMLPAYMLLTPNPDTESHWIWRKYHPDSVEARKLTRTHAYFEAPSTDNPHLSKELLHSMLSRDEAWVKRYVYGQWGISGATIHKILPLSIIEYNAKFVTEIIKHGTLTRSYDHGESAPSCCLWWSAWHDYHICYREYYKGDALISHHRERINTLSGDERYRQSLADPAIFKKASQKDGAHWTTADEYLSSALKDPSGNTLAPIAWIPADNNEMATRNRFNEMLGIDLTLKHPISGRVGAPRMYFIEAAPEYPYGCNEVIKQTRDARREKLTEIDGKPIYTDDRVKSDADHAYDPARYYVAAHIKAPVGRIAPTSETSFNGARKRAKAMEIESKNGRKYFSSGDRRSLA